MAVVQGRQAFATIQFAYYILPRLANPYSHHNPTLRTNYLDSRIAINASHKELLQEDLKNMPLYNMHQHNKAGQSYPLSFSLQALQRTIHNAPIKTLLELKIPFFKIHKPMETLSQIYIRYLTHVILNKCKLEKKIQPQYCSNSPNYQYPCNSILPPTNL